MINIPDKYLDLLQKKKAFATLATAMPDGSPQVTPVWFDYSGGRVRVNTAKGRVKARNLKKGAPVALAMQVFRNGGARPPKVARVQTFSDGDELDVPGRPKVVYTPGHSPGHCALHVPAEGSAFTGDALCGWNVVTGEQGPTLPPREFSNSMAQARASLERIAALDAQTLYFGHGEPWTRGAAAAVAEARARDKGAG